MRPLDLFGVGVKSYSSVVTSQRRLNCFYDLRQDGDKSTVAIIGTPGKDLAFTLNTSPVRGWWVVGSVLYVVAGAAVWKVNTSYTATFLGNLTTTTGKVGMADDGVRVGIVDGVGGYTILLATDAFSTIVDANFPAGATTITFLNGRVIVEKPSTRQFWLSQSYDMTDWTPITFGTKENKSDVLKAVSTFNGMLVLWGESSIEFWQADASTQLTVSRINGATQDWGIAAKNTIREVENVQYFLGAKSEGGFQVVQLNGYVPEPVSTSDIDSIINDPDFGTVSDAVAFSYTVYGHSMYQLTFPTNSRSFIFDTKSRVWSEVQTGLALLARDRAELGITFNNLNLVSDYENGKVYVLNANTYTDNGTQIKRQVLTRHLRNEGNRFSITDLYLDMETGVGLQTGQGSAPLLMVRVSKDGGRTFGNERTASIGAVGAYETRLIMRRFGQARDFVFEFTMTDPVKFVLLKGSAKIDASEGADG